MRISVRVRAGAKEERVVKVAETGNLFASGKETAIYKVSVKEPPIDGKANEAVARVLADYLCINRRQVELVSGFSSKNKVFEIKK